MELGEEEREVTIEPLRREPAPPEPIRETPEYVPAEPVEVPVGV